MRWDARRASTADAVAGVDVYEGHGDVEGVGKGHQWRARSTADSVREDEIDTGETERRVGGRGRASRGACRTDAMRGV